MVTRKQLGLVELESSLEALLFKRVRLAGGRAVKVIAVVKGTPDRYILMPRGRIYLVELKADNGVLSDAQILFKERAAELGIEVVVLRGRQAIIDWVSKVTV